MESRLRWLARDGDQGRGVIINANKAGKKRNNVTKQKRKVQIFKNTKHRKAKRKIQDTAYWKIQTSNIYETLKKTFKRSKFRKTIISKFENSKIRKEIN